MAIGKINTDATGKILRIEKEYYRQGMIFKDEDAYRNRKNEPCYVPELSDSIYTGEDFLNMCNGQQEFADELFAEVDWQHPETLMEELLKNNEWVTCEDCGTLIDFSDGCNDKICPKCGRKVEY
jgi:rubrerythrin